jgi:hypothetical protein
VSFTAPWAWPRTSRDGSVLPTYGPVRLGGNCTVNILAELDLVAVRALTLPTLRTAGVGGLGQADPVASDIGPARAWAVVIEDPHFVKAVGLVRVARHRYAGLRVYVRLYPTCTPAASRDRALLRGVRKIVSRVAARITIRPRAGG